MKNINNETDDTLSSLPLILGTLAPIIFVAIFTIDGLFRKDYSAISMHISALSLGSLGWIQIMNFLILGVFLFVFSLRILSENIQEHKSKTGSIILLISSICFFLSGPFIMDPMGTLRENATTHGIIHGILGGIVFLLMPVTCFVFANSFKNEKSWVYFSKWTLSLGIMISIALIIFTLVTKIEYLNKFFIDYLGLIQRAVLVPYMIWLFTFALRKITNRYHQFSVIKV
jgi:hypothetical protein